jgi:hypothetical protein
MAITFQRSPRRDPISREDGAGFVRESECTHLFRSQNLNLRNAILFSLRSESLHETPQQLESRSGSVVERPAHFAVRQLEIQFLCFFVQ